MENTQDTRVMTTKEWLVTLILLAIPFVNIILFFVWAFSASGNLNRRNYCRAGLILLAVFFVIWLISFILVMTFGGGMDALKEAGALQQQ
jgi:amino acid transporter